MSLSLFSTDSLLNGTDFFFFFLPAVPQGSPRWSFYGCDAEGGREAHAVVPRRAPAYGQGLGTPTTASLQHQQRPALSKGETDCNSS